MAGRLGDKPGHCDRDPVPHPGPGSATQEQSCPHQLSWDLLYQDSILHGLPLSTAVCGHICVTHLDAGTEKCPYVSLEVTATLPGLWSLLLNVEPWPSKGESPEELRPCCTAQLQLLQEQVLAERLSLGEDSCTGGAEQGGDAAGHLHCLWAVSQPCSPLIRAPRSLCGSQFAQEGGFCVYVVVCL